MYEWQYPQTLCYEAEKARVKAEVTANVRLREAEIKQQMREATDERKRHIGEKLVITENGEVEVVTTNLSVEAVPRVCTNLRKPKLELLYTSGDETDIFRLSCLVANMPVDVYLNSEMVGNGSYLLRKFAAGGIYFCTETAKAKKYAVQLLCIQQQNLADEIWIPNGEGWVKNEDDDFIHIEEDDMTWEKVKNRAK